MNPFAAARRRPITTFLLVLGLASGSALVLETVGVDVIPVLDAEKIESVLDRAGSMAIDRVSSMAMAAEPEKQVHEEHQKIVVTSPKALDVTITEPYVCQIHSRRHIEICALEGGYLEEVLVSEGQAVKKGDLMYKILPTLYQAKLDAKEAEAQLAELEYTNTKNLADKNVVSQNEVKLLQAKLARAQAEAELARAELNFTQIVAPFDGIVDRLHSFQGSLIAEGDVLTTLSDNSVMWVYFNMPEARYLEYMADRSRQKEDDRLELRLANGIVFPQVGTIGAIEATFNNETGNIAFRGDFPNPDGLLRNGQTGTMLISRIHEDSIVIPQRATFEILDKRYVYVVGEDDVVHQRLITIEHEKDDIFTVGSGLTGSELIVLEGIREVHDGEKVEYEFQDPEEVLAHLKYHAE
jgi:membrane fusion protein (multidrug efflux system)